MPCYLIFFFFNDTATTEIYTLSLHDALPIFPAEQARHGRDVLRHRAVREQAVSLDHIADPAPQQVRRLAGRVVAVDQHPTAGRLDEAIDHEIGRASCRERV